MDRLRRFLFCFLAAGLTAIPSLAETPVGGRILGPDGQGLEGVRVGLEPTRPEFDRVDTRLDGKLGPGADAVATTDADGYFELLAPRLGRFKVVVPWRGGAEVSGELPEYVLQEYLLRPLTEATELPPVRLDTAEVLKLRVADPDGGPGDARLGIYDTRRRRGAWRTRLRLARSGDDGIVRLPHSSAEELRLELLGASHPLLIFNAAEIPDAPSAPKDAGEFAELRLAAGVTGTVRATDRRGRVLAGALVFQGYGILPLGRTDAEGRLQLTVAPAEYEPPTVTVITRDGYRGAFEPRFSPDGTTETTVVLEPRPRLRGQVIDRESRDPVPGALVWEANGSVAETDARGTYELTVFRTRRVTVMAVAEGYRQSIERRELEGSSLEDGPTLALSPAATVTGQVSDEDGNPLAGVDIAAEPSSLTAPRSPYDRRPRSARSTRRGHFAVSGLLPSMSYELTFRKEGFAPSRHTVEALEAFEDRRGLDVVLGAGISGVGRVEEEDGTPVAGAEVRLLRVVTRDPRMPARASDDDGESPLGSTDAEGRFRLGHLAPGRYNLAVEASGFAAATVPGIRLEAGSSETDFGTVVLMPGARVAGVVTDPDGVPVEGAEIHIARDSGPVLIGHAEPLAKSDARGRFFLPDLRAGEQVHLAVAKTGFSSAVASAVAADGETVEVVLQPVGAVSGRVRNQDGEAVAGASVSANVRQVNPQHYVYNVRQEPRQTDEQGYFRLDEVDAGPVQLSVSAEGYQSYGRRDLEVPPGGELNDLDVVLVRGGTIVGTVTREDGTPVVQVQVRYSTDQAGSLYGGGFQQATETDGEGRFRFQGLARGPAQVSAHHGEHRHVSKSVDVAAGPQTVDLVFGGGFEVSGRVTDASGLAVAGAAVSLTTADQFQHFYYPASPSTTAADGTFTLTDVAAGRYHLSAAKEGYAQAKTAEPFEVGDGAGVVIDLELPSGATLRGRILGLELDDLVNVQVQAFGATSGGMQQGLVDYEGRYSIPDLGPGPWSVIASLQPPGRQTHGQVTVAEGQLEVELDLEFKTGYPLAGRVTSSGEPQAGLHVGAHGLEPGLSNGQATTGSDGRFRLDHLPAGKYRLQVTGHGSGSFQEVEVPAPAEVVIEIAVARISGFVWDETGDHPMVGASLRLERVETDPANPFMGFGGTGGMTDSRGHFSLTASEGLWRVIASKAGHGPASAIVEVLAGRQAETIELRMVPTEGISFEVVHSSGTVPSQVHVAVIDPSGWAIFQGMMAVGDGGTMRLSTVPPGTWQLVLQSGDSAVVTAAITAPGAVGRLELPQGGVLHIKVPALESQLEPSLENMKNLARVRLTGLGGLPHYMIGNPGASATAWPVWNGQAMIHRLAPGAWKFTISHPDGRTWTGEATVTPGATSEVVVP